MGFKLKVVSARGFLLESPIKMAYSELWRQYIFCDDYSYAYQRSSAILSVNNENVR